MVVAVKRCLVGISVRSCTTGGQDAIFMLLVHLKSLSFAAILFMVIVPHWVSCMWSLIRHLLWASSS